MGADEIRDAVLAAIAAVAPEADVRQLRGDQPLREQIDLDSIDWINVLAGVQQRLGIAIPDADAARLATLDDWVAYLAAAPRLGEASAGGELPHRRITVNGTAVTLRPMCRDDLPLEADFVRHLSPDSRYERFMVTVAELPEAKLRYLTDVDQMRHVALVATVPRDGSEAIVGVARYIVDAAGSGCEFAIALDDGWHGTGLAGLLMHALIALARARGLRTMQGFVLASNTRMLRFARGLGFRAERHPQERDTIRVVLAL